MELPFPPPTIVDPPLRTVLTYPQPEINHNGGSVVFGPDGYLYLALGDGGSLADGYVTETATYWKHFPTGNAQNLDSLLGKILRIDPTPSADRAYTIPPDNPFVDTDGADEIWAYGLRNPFRISFDRETGDLWVADVGQGRREEVNRVPADHDRHPGGRAANFGWNRFTGEPAGPDTTNALSPPSPHWQPMLTMPAP